MPSGFHQLTKKKSIGTPGAISIDTDGTVRGRLLTVRSILKDRLPPGLIPFIEAPLEHFLSFDRLNEAYAKISNDQDVGHFLERVVKMLNIRYEITEQDLDRIPRNGPVIVVSNHPFGGAEGIILARLLRSVRSDVKVMANYLLGCIRELHDMLIFVDPYQREDSPAKNLRPVKEAIEWVKGGGMLGVFPAGEVSHIQPQTRDIADPRWHEGIGGVIQKSGATVLPVFFGGCNSALFQILGLAHPRVRTVLLPRELFNKGMKKIPVRVGTPIHSRKLETFGTRGEMMRYLRFRTYMLKNRNSRKTTDDNGLHGQNSRAQRMKPILPPQHKTLLEHEICCFQADRILLESGDYIVFHEEGQHIPCLLQEIGRLRETTFRLAGEGTGKSVDLDCFDPYYTHLFVWNRVKKELVGAYRLGKTDEILKRFGKKGLYTSTLFHYKTALLARMGPALELGRSFVRSEYQRTYAPLLLLWRGIGEVVRSNPRYKTLFGPVSISKDYHSLSRQLMVTFLRVNNFLPDLARLVRPRRPFRIGRVDGWDGKIVGAVMKDLDDISGFISDIESDDRDIPVLLRQYLKLGGKLIDFSRDEKFSDVLDGLMLADLTKTERRILERYMGREGARTFLAYHGAAAPG